MKKLLFVALISLVSTSVSADTFTKTDGTYSKEMSTKRVASYLKRRKNCTTVTVKTSEGKEITGSCEEVLKQLIK